MRSTDPRRSWRRFCSWDVVRRRSLTRGPSRRRTRRASRSFDDTANPDAKHAVPGVFVTLCIANQCTTDLAPRKSDATTSAPDGTWGPLDQIFGGSPFEDTKIEVRFEADGFETFSYTAIYEKTQDPWAGQSFLNVHLRRTIPLPRRPAHPSLGDAQGTSRSAARPGGERPRPASAGLQQAPRDLRYLDLVRPAVDLKHARIAEQLLDAILRHVSVAAE